MLYYLFDWLHNSLNIPGAGVFQYISFRAAAAIITTAAVPAMMSFFLFMSNLLKPNTLISNLLLK